MLPFSHTIWFTGLGDTGDKWWIKSHDFINNWTWHRCALQSQNRALNSKRSVLLCKAKFDKIWSCPFWIIHRFCCTSGGCKSCPKLGAKIQPWGKKLQDPIYLLRVSRNNQISTNNTATYNNYYIFSAPWRTQHGVHFPIESKWIRSKRAASSSDCVRGR